VAEKLVKQLQSHEEDDIDMSAWLKHYTCDLTGRFDLTVNFNNLSRGEPHPILVLYHITHRRLRPLAATPWIKHLLMGISYIKENEVLSAVHGLGCAELDSNIIILR